MIVIVIILHVTRYTTPLNLIEKYHIPVENIKIKLNIIQNFDDEEDDDYNKNNVVIDLQQIPQTRNESIQVAQQTFKQNFNTSSLRTSIENNITENVNNIKENIEDNVDETLGDLGKEIHSNLKNKNE